MANIIQQIGRYIGGFLTEGSSLIFGMGNKEVYVDISAQNVRAKGFNSNTAVYSIVKKDANKFGSIPRYLYDASVAEEKTYNKRIRQRRNIERKAEILDNDLSILLNRPNKNEGQDAFFAKVRAGFKVSGEAFIWLNRGDGMGVDETGQLVKLTDEQMAIMPVLEMYAIPATNIIVIQDPTDLHNISDFLLEINGKRLRLGKPNVIHWRDINLDDIDPVSGTHLRGRPALLSGYRSLQANNDSSNSEVRMYQNDGAKGVLTNKTLNKMSPVQRTQLEKVINSKINNNDIKGAVATLEGDWAYINIGISSVDMQLLEGKKMSWQELCFLMDMPYEFFDSHSPYSEKQLAQLGWVTNTIMPATKQLDGELNRVLLKAFNLERKAFIACDYWDLPEMQDVRLRKAEALSKIWAITPNVILDEMGYDKSTDPLMDEQWIPNNVTPLSYIQDQNIMNQISNQLKQFSSNGTNDLGGNSKGNTSKVSNNGVGN